MVLQATGRAMGLQDSNPRSRTWGCCDRGYWQYRTVSGFPAATMQQLALPFAILYTAPFAGNTHAGDPAMLERAAAAMRFWCSAQHRDGSFDEWYRNEHSYCATAFTAFAVSESLLRLEGHLEDERRARIMPHLLRAARWLERRFNPDVMNQNLAACAALQNTYRLTQEARFREAFRERWHETSAQLDQEGWFREYGGADAGYGTLALDLLACLHRAGAGDEVANAAARSARWLDSLACGDGAPAARLGSRGTAHGFPYGASYFAEHFPEAAALAAHLRRGIQLGLVPGPADADDRYLAYFYLPHFALACTVAPRSEERSSPRAPYTLWPRSGFVVRRSSGGEIAVSLRRQGAFNLCVAGRPEHGNLGYWAETSSGARWTSAAWNPGDVDADPPEASCLRVRGRFAAVADALPLARSALPFTLFSEVALRWPAAADRFKRALRPRLIARRREMPLAFERTIAWEDDAVLVTDSFRALPGCPRLVALGPVDETDTVSPSARMHPRLRSRGAAASVADARAWADRLGRDGSLTLRLVYAPDPAGRLVPGRIEAGPPGGGA
jgi:hypothetical protein